MHIQHRTFQLCLALCCALGILLGAWWILPTAQQPSTDQGIGLRAPAFISVAHAASEQTAKADFLDEEAGISAYTNIGKQIVIDEIANFFDSDLITKRTAEFLVATVVPPGYDAHREQMSVQVYVHQEGWIVAYLLADYQPTSMIFDWINYTSSSSLNTTLEKVVQQIAKEADSNRNQISYYHFQYPKATNLMLIADMEEAGQTWDQFNVKIPEDIIVFEGSWSYATYDSVYRNSTFEIDGQKLVEIVCPSCWHLVFLERESLTSGDHTIRIYNYNGKSYGGIALVYQELQ